MAASILRQGKTALAPAVLQTRISFGKAATAEMHKHLPEAFAPEYCVRNTFIDTVPSRRPSLEDFLPRTRCSSAPCPVAGPRVRHESIIDPVYEEHTAGWSGLDAAVSCSSTSLAPQVDSTCAMGSMTRHGFMPAIVSMVNLNPSGISLMSTSVFPNWTPITQQSDSQHLQMAELTNSLPSEGSIGHEAGVCKPCAWYHSSKGCQTGTSCKFCHACAPGELKRRKKEKNALLASQNAGSRA